MRWITERALERWQRKGLLSSEKATQLQAEMAGGGANRGVRIFGAIGAVLVGLGVILFVSSNWDSMERGVRIGVLLAGYAIFVAAALAAAWRDLPKASEALWLVSTLVLGANIFLIAQIFHSELSLWQGTLRWMIGAAVLGWAIRSRFQAAVAVPLGILTLGWMGFGASSIVQVQMMLFFSDVGLQPILPLVGVGLISLSLLVARSRNWAFSRGSCLGWGLALLVLTAVVSTIDPKLAGRFFDFEGTNIQISILVAVALLLGGAMLYGHFQWPASRILLGVLALYSAAMLIQVDGRSWVGMTHDGAHLLFAGHVAMVFAFTLWTIWTGLKARNVVLVNVAMANCALLIVIQYFSWSFALLDRSAAFIFGGLLLLTLAVMLEKKRRVLVESIQPIGGV